MARRAHKLSIPSRTSELARVRKCVSAWAAEAGLSDDEGSALQCAVDEACANAIEHGYNGNPDGRVELEADLKPDALVVTVRHQGEPFDPKTHNIIALTEMRSGRRQHGYGLHLMHKLVDDVRFMATKNSSEVRLTKLKSASKQEKREA